MNEQKFEPKNGECLVFIGHVSFPSLELLVNQKINFIVLRNPVKPPQHNSLSLAQQPYA